MGVRVIRTLIGAPNANAYAEGVIETRTRQLDPEESERACPHEGDAPAGGHICREMGVKIDA